jgi:hypothetical protein
VEGWAAMIWQDIVIDRLLSDHEIAHALSDAFGVQPSEVLVGHDEHDFPDPGQAQVICMSSTLGGGFPQLLSIYLYGATGSLQTIDIIKNMCTKSNFSCLFDDGSPNPYTMNLATRAGEVRRVNIDPDLLDDRGEYHLLD